jgi:succinate dehydrogenase/fumarate reductase cytochrome b subunit
MDHDEPTLADLMSDPVTLAVMNADGVHPGDLAAALTQISASFAASLPETVDQEDRANGSAIFRSVPADRKSEVEPPLREATRTSWDSSVLRHHLRLVSGLILLAFVLCHLTAHSFLLVSLERAEGALDTVMYPWRSMLGTAILVSALLIHYLNALWSIYVRRYLRLSRWEGWQLGLGLCIPLLLMLHVAGTRVAESVLGVSSH